MFEWLKNLIELLFKSSIKKNSREDNPNEIPKLNNSTEYSGGKAKIYKPQNRKSRRETLVDIYSIPRVNEVILRDEGRFLAPMKCIYCHRAPCKCTYEEIQSRLKLEKLILEF